MPICDPCQPEHSAGDCEDVVTARTGVQRRCYCQHKPRPGTQGSTVAAVGGAGYTEDETPTERTTR